MNAELSEALNEAKKKIKNGDYEGALDVCRHMLLKFPKSYKIYEKRSEIHYRAGNYEDAFSDLEQVSELMPGEPAPIFRRGRWKLNLGNYEDAINAMTEVIDMNSQYFIDSAYFFRAIAFLYSHEFKKALADCEHVPDDIYMGPKYISKKVLVNKAVKGLKR